MLARAGLATLVVEARDAAGGCCVTEEIAPGCRASTTSYIASMLRPEVIRALDLGAHGLRMVPCEPALQVALDDGEVARRLERPGAYGGRDRPVLPGRRARVPRGARRAAAAGRPAAAAVHGAAAGHPGHRACAGCSEALRVGRHLRGLRGTDVEGLTRMLTGSLGQFIDARFESRQAKALLLANNLYGKHGGPYQPGTLIGLLFHLLTGGEDAVQGFFGHVMGGMGAISDAIAAAGQAHGMRIRTGSPVARIRVAAGRAQGVTLASGEELTARVVLSGADPKRTFLHLVDQADLPADFRAAVAGITMDGPCAKVNLVLDAEPQVRGMPADAGPGQRALFTLPPDLAVADACYDRAKRGELADAGAAVRGLRGGLGRGPVAGARRPAHHDLLRAVRAVPAGRGDLGHPAGRARRPGPGPDRAVRAERARRGAGPAGAHPAGPGARLRADRGQHLPRRHRSPASCSTCGRCRAGRATPPRSAACTCAARAPTRVAGSPGRPATTRPTGSWPTCGGTGNPGGGRPRERPSGGVTSPVSDGGHLAERAAEGRPQPPSACGRETPDERRRDRGRGRAWPAPPPRSTSAASAPVTCSWWTATRPGRG